MPTTVKALYKPDLSMSRSIPAIEMATVPAGFPSPAGDYEESQLDFNRELIKNPAATYCVRVSGDSMIGAGIHHGDLLIVDRSKEPRHGSIVIAIIDGEFTVKRLSRSNGKCRLVPENDDYLVTEISRDMRFEIWGVVTNVIHSLE